MSNVGAASEITMPRCPEQRGFWFMLLRCCDRYDCCLPIGSDRRDSQPYSWRFVLSNLRKMNMKSLKFLMVAVVLMLVAVVASEVLNAGVTSASAVHAPAAKASCPYGPHPGDTGIWTGRTKTVNAKPFYEQKCIQGHKWFTKTPS